MSVDALFFWVLILAFCELGLAGSMASMLGTGAVLILTLCAWLVRLDLDLLAFLVAATYSSVLVCLTLVQSNLEGHPGLAGVPNAGARVHTADAFAALMFGATFVGTFHQTTLFGALADFYQGEGDWLEQVVGVFHLFFYRTATFEALLLNLFLLTALMGSLSLLSTLSAAAAGGQGLALRGAARVRLVRAFRRQVRRKNSSQIRASKR